MSVTPTSPSYRRRPWFHLVIYRPLTVSTALAFYQRHGQGKREIMGLIAVAVRVSQDRTNAWVWSCTRIGSPPGAYAPQSQYVAPPPSASTLGTQLITNFARY